MQEYASVAACGPLDGHMYLAGIYTLAQSADDPAGGSFVETKASCARAQRALAVKDTQYQQFESLIVIRPKLYLYTVIVFAQL